MKQSENKGRTFIEFVRLFTEADTVSRADIMEKMNLKESAFYKYLAECRKVFTIKCEGSIGGNAYYSIDKKSVASYFNIHRDTQPKTKNIKHQELIRMYNAGESLTDMAKMCNTSNKSCFALIYYLIKKGLVKKRKSQQGRRLSSLTEPDVIKIQTAFQSGKSRKEIQQIYGTSYATICRIVNKKTN